MQVTVEFYGVPRQRAGWAELVVAGETLAGVLAAVQRACPGLRDLVGADGRLAPSYRISINGERFVDDLGERLAAGERVLILSADAGG
jgi:molybdopterin converting factor small subunit